MKVSVITISFNNAAGLRRTIESVIAQDYIDYEYIVIDGGSTDGSKDIIEQYANHINYWVSEPDKGVYNAMNKGIAIANGEYLHFLNSGDIYASTNVLSSVFAKPFTEPLLRGCQICDYGNRTERWENLGNRPVTVYDMFVNTMLHQATFIRKDMFQKYGLYDEILKIVSDWKFFFQAILGGEQTAFVDTDVVVFEMDGISTNKSHGEQHLAERKQVITELMSANLLPDYERLKTLENNVYIIEFVKKNSLAGLVFKILNRMYKLLGINK
ncbi:glycosyltransferase family 2 protein [Dysgonomonas macrotermitis]|uniref:Glycosyl transferase family 2 n=1 Tax=Dysgonomonas macrotermitis TaxID=1346286 RepID=A0A1M5DU13_9BACT|nr:glycosyltransferase family 2 protein [Dysgonomonas macrotermitis]SHF70430.1 Glycosyl transferase family 2 [Dysgonomonas macrotermitis]